MSGYNSTYTNPSLFFLGEGKTRDLIEKLSNDGFKKVLLHYGGGSIKRNGVFDEVTGLLKEMNVEFVEAGGQKPNPELEIINESIEIFKKNDCDCILAVGGGSVIDSSKAIAIGTFEANPRTVWDYYSNGGSLEGATPIYCVLTLSATGSESNFGSVVSKSDENRKFAYMDPHMLPKASCIDPKHHMSLPWWQTVNGAVDTLSHLLEQYQGCAITGCHTPAYVIEGTMRAIIDATERIKKEDTPLARGDFAFASNLGLNGIYSIGTNGGTWQTHMIAHQLAACFKKERLSHGACLGVLTVPVLIRLSQKEMYAPLMTRLAKNVFDCDTIEAAMEAWKAMLAEWGHPNTLSVLLGETPAEEYLVEVAKTTVERGIMHLDEEEVLNILKACI